MNRDFPGSPVGKTPCFQGKGHKFNPCEELRSHMPGHGAKKKGKKNQELAWCSLENCRVNCRVNSEDLSSVLAPGISGSGMNHLPKSGQSLETSKVTWVLVRLRNTRLSGPARGGTSGLRRVPREEPETSHSEPRPTVPSLLRRGGLQGQREVRKV